MNKLSSICFTLAIAAGFVACSDNEVGNEYLRENTVQVVKSNLFFNAAAQKGGAKVMAPAGSTVYTTESWATAELSGDSVTVSVTNNPLSDSRSAVLTIKNGNDSTNISILQKGCEYEFKGKKTTIITDDEATVEFPFSALGAEPTMKVGDGYDATAVSSIERGDQSFKAHFTANKTGEVRTVQLIVDNVGVKDTVYVTQGSLSDFLEKSFTLTGFDLLRRNNQGVRTLEDTRVSIYGVIWQDKDGKIYFDASKFNMSFPLTFDATTLSFTVKGNELLATGQTTSGIRRSRRTAIWDFEHYLNFDKIRAGIQSDYQAGKVTAAAYQEFMNTVLPNVYHSFAAPELAMSASMYNNGQAVEGQLRDVPTNAPYVATLEGLKSAGLDITKYRASVLALQDYLGEEDNLTFSRAAVLLFAPKFIHVLPSAQPAASRANIALTPAEKKALNDAELLLRRKTAK